MRRVWTQLVLVAGALALAWPAQARDPKWSGLAGVALSPDGKTIATGGANRVLYVVDAESFEVRQRIWMEARIGNVAFNGDGSQLLVEDDEETLHFLSTKTWKETRQVPKAGFISVAPAADLVATLEKSSSTGSTIRFLSMKDGSVAGSVTTTANVHGFDLAADGKQLVVLSGPVDGDEKKVASSAIPKELKGLAKEEFKQKNDGKVASLSVFSVPDGESKGSSSLWYSSTDSDALLASTDGATFVFEYSNLLAQVKGDAVAVSEGRSGYNYGKGISADRKVVATGGLRDGAVYRLPAMEMTEFKLDRIAGWPEYFEAFAIAGDGTVYGVTSAYRLTKVDPNGAVVKTVPVF